MKHTLSRSTVMALVMTAIAGTAIPILLMWWLVWRQPALDPGEVQRRMTAGTVTLVDVRSAEDYARQHITGSVSLADAPAGGALVTVCDDGLRSAQTTAELRLHGREAFTLAGGIGNWIAAARHPGVITTGLTIHGVSGPIPIRQESFFIQGMLIFTGFVVKPIYMLMALVFAWQLRRIRTPGITALRRSLWWFYIGEAFCAANYAVFDEESLVADHLHSTGMLMSVAFALWAVYLGLHRHILGNDGTRCGLSTWCRPCTRDSVCRIDQAFPLGLGMLALMACVPLSVEPLPAWTSLTTVFGTPYAYRHEMPFQIIEIRWYPLFGLFLLGVALLAWWRGMKSTSAVWACAAAGCIVFALFRVSLVHLWRDDPAWFLIWEELGEWATLIAVWWWLPVLRRPAESTP